MAYVYVTLGEADADFEWLEKAYERRQLAIPWIGVVPILDPLRSDPASGTCSAASVSRGASGSGP